MGHIANRIKSSVKALLPGSTVIRVIWARDGGSNEPWYNMGTLHIPSVALPSFGNVPADKPPIEALSNVLGSGASVLGGELKLLAPGVMP